MASNVRLALIVVGIPPLLSTALDVSSTASPQGKVLQFVSITFDDNFGLAAPGAVGGCLGGSAHRLVKTKTLFKGKS